MHENDAEFEIRDFFKEPFSADELLRLIGSNSLTDFVSTRAKSYKQLGWDKKLPTKRAAMASIIQDATLLRRPILVVNGKVIIGFSQSEYENLVAARG